MKFNVAGALSYNVNSASTFILNIHAQRTVRQSIQHETFATNGDIHAEEMALRSNGNRFVRFAVTGPLYLNINYSATVNTKYELVPFDELTDVPIIQLDNQVLPYLLPSRYCQSDKLFRFAHNKFGDRPNNYQKVLALVDWIHNNVEYLSGSTNSQTSAFDTATEQAGVCRDFAHLGIALCRALDIPARYFTGYAYQLNPPDFHACFEAFIGNKWIIFDATHLVPLNGLVKISNGRDAADASIATIFGDVYGTFTSASCLLADTDFEPYYYTSDTPMGLSYL